MIVILVLIGIVIDDFVFAAIGQRIRRRRGLVEIDG